MGKRYREPTIHQKMASLIEEMVDKEILFKDALREFEKIFLDTASKKYHGNKTKMAKALGIHRNTLHNRTKAVGK